MIPWATAALAATPPTVPQVTVCDDPYTTCTYVSLSDALEYGETNILVLAGEHPGRGIIYNDNTVIRGEVDGSNTLLTALLNTTQETMLVVQGATGVALIDLEMRGQAAPIEPRSVMKLQPGSELLLHHVNVNSGWAASGAAGGLDVDASDVTIEDSTFEGNNGSWGGAIYLGPYSNAWISDSVFQQNTAVADGGAIHADGATLTITNTEFDDNEAQFSAGGHIRALDTVLEVTGGRMLNGEAVNGGGAVFADGLGTLTLVGARLEGNVATSDNGAGVRTKALQSVVLDGVTATRHVGSEAVHVTEMGGPVTITHSTFEGNDQGALYVYAVEQLTLDDTWVCNSDTDQPNAVMVVGGCQLGCTVTDSAFAANRLGEGRGGGIRFQDPEGPIDILRSTFVDNEAPNGSAIALSGFSDKTLTGVLMAWQQRSPALDVAGAGPPVDLTDVATWANAGGDLGGPVDGGVHALLEAPLLTAQPDRCPQQEILPECGAPENQWLFDHQAGAGTGDADGDGLADACDPDPYGTTGTTEPPTTGTTGGTDWATPPTDTTPGDTGPTGGGRDGVGPLDTFLLGGGGCGCSGAAARSGWLTLVRRRSASR